MEQDPIAAPVPDQNARTWAMLSHLLALLGYVIGLGQVIAPLVIYLVKREEHEFIADQARESLNFQITVLILALLLLPTICIGIGVVLLPLLGVYQLVFVIVAALQANEGKRYRYPLTLRLVR